MTSSIVEKVIFRSLTGKKIGVDIHRHYDRKLHLCWKSKINIKYIERYDDDDDGSEFDQIMKELNDPGIDGVC
jgi:hypothetical protein